MDEKRKKMVKKKKIDCKHRTKNYKIFSGLLTFLSDNFTLVFILSKFVQLVKFTK